MRDRASTSASTSAFTGGDRRRVVVVTGASSGIGRATAVLLTQQGSHVVLASRSRTTLAAARADCVPGTTLVVPTDVSDRVQVRRLLSRARAAYGCVDAVVHSAAVLAYGRFEDVPADVFDRAVDVTLTGTANVARASLELFHQQGEGALVVVGSLLGKIVTPYMSSYVTAKWAVHGLVRTLQVEARETPGIHISLVSPGGVDTPIYLQAGTYLGRHGRPPPPVVSAEQVAAVIVRRIDHPARDSDVGLTNTVAVLGFRSLPAMFDRIVTPLMRAGGLSDEPVGPTTGNVVAPRPEGESGHGRWPTPSGREVSAPGPGRADDDAGLMTVSRIVQAPPAAVWAVLADGWRYADWVVGASRVRSVTTGWPGVGSRVDHSFGAWPAAVDQVTRCLEAEPERRLVLKAGGRPLGDARVEVGIDDLGDGRCRTSMTEDVVSGPGLLVPVLMRQAAVALRNGEALRRLALIAEGRGNEVGTG